jgi:DNA-binding transcriptional LysR family regulator
MIDLRRLRLLRELETRGTITAVAHALHFTPSAVSQQLARLERETGVMLLEPIGRGVRLTDAGRLLAGHAERILGAVDAAEADLEAQAGAVQGSLRVGTFQTAALALITPALERLARTHPALEVQVVEADFEETFPELRVGELDIVCEDEYKAGPSAGPLLHREDLFADRLRLVLPREDPLAAAAKVSIADLSDQPWASGPVGGEYARAVESACRERGGFDPRVLHRASDLMFLLSLVRVGRAVALLPDLLGAEHDQRVAVRSIVGGDPSRTIYTVVRASSARRPSILALRQALADVAAVAAPALGPRAAMPAVSASHHPRSAQRVQTQE